ncbi:MAG: efflux RND transporter periplasmic adaptor subunit, partial [Rikenellaceae bacterium]
MNKKVFVILVVCAVIVGIAVAGTLTLLKPEKNLIQGQVDATAYKVSSKLAGRIEKLYVSKGAKVTKGEPLFLLSTPEVSAKHRQALAAKAGAVAQYDKAEAGAR